MHFVVLIIIFILGVNYLGFWPTLLVFIAMIYFTYENHKPELERQEKEKKKKQERKEKSDKHLKDLLLPLQKGSRNITFISKSFDKAILFDQDRQSFYYTTPQHKRPRQFPVSKVSHLELKIDEESISLSETKVDLGAAAIGGLMFGSGGAVVGALATKKGETKEKKTVHSIDLILHFRDLSIRPIELRLENNDDGINEPRQSEILVQIDRLKAAFEHTSKTPLKATVAQTKPTSVADEISKLQVLLDRNVLTRQQFEKEKSKLLE
jgi:hypothetical protein